MNTLTFSSASDATSSPPARAPFHVLAKPSGSLCNLACRYCFYLEKSHLYQGKTDFRMSAGTLEAFVRDYISAQPGPVVSFGWQGGEPTLLGVSFFQEAIALQRRHAQGKTIENSFQTNGVLLNDEWGKFLAAEKFLVGISIDGPSELHDAYRVDRGGKPTFDKVMAGLEVLKRHKVPFNTLTTVHRANSAYPQAVYRFLKKTGSRYLQFIPIVERAAGPATEGTGLWLAPPPDHEEASALDKQVTPWSVRPADYGAFLCGVFDEWVERDVGRVFVQQFDAALANWAGERPGVCVFAEKCGRALALEHNGDVYSCDHYVYPAYRLGNLLETPLATLVDSPRQRHFGDMKSEGLPRFCKECPVRFACHGECPKHRFLTTPDGEPGLNYLCRAYKRFFTHIDPAMATMAALLKERLAPATIMSLRKEHWLPGRARG